MSMTVKCQAAPPTAGEHVAKCDEVREVPGQFDRPALRFHFATRDGAEISKLAGTELVEGNSLHKLVEAMLGKPIARGEQIDLHDFVGREFTIVVAPANGGNSVAIANIRPAAADA